MHAQEVMRDVSDSTLPLPVVDTTHKTIVDILTGVLVELCHTQHRRGHSFYIWRRNGRCT